MISQKLNTKPIEKKAIFLLYPNKFYIVFIIIQLKVEELMNYTLFFICTLFLSILSQIRSLYDTLNFNLNHFRLYMRVGTHRGHNKCKGQPLQATLCRKIIIKVNLYLAAHSYLEQLKI